MGAGLGEVGNPQNARPIVPTRALCAAILVRTPTQVNAKGVTSAAIYLTHLCGLVRIQTGKLNKHVREARYNPCHPLVINDLRPIL